MLPLFLSFLMLFISTSVRYTSKILSKLDHFSPHLHISTQTNHHHLLPDSSNGFLALPWSVPTVQAILQRCNSKILQNEVFPKARWVTATKTRTSVKASKALSEAVTVHLSAQPYLPTCPSLTPTLPCWTLLYCLDPHSALTASWVQSNHPIFLRTKFILVDLMFHLVSCYESFYSFIKVNIINVQAPMLLFQLWAQFCVIVCEKSFTVN